MKASIKWLVLFSCLKKSGLFLCPFLRNEVSAMANRIMGITVEIGGDTTKLQTALKGVNGQIKRTQQQLKDVDKLLKLDPGNTELLACITQVKAKNGIIERENYENTRISNNLNQYARKANETGKLYEEDIAEIKKMNNEQTELLKKALEAVIHLYEDGSKKRK